MEKKKKRRYFLWILLAVILVVVFGNQREQRKILPENIPKRFLKNKPNYKKYPIDEAEHMKKMEAWKWEGEASFGIEKRKEQKGSWIAYYPVFSSSSYPEEAKKINENLEAYLKSWQETYFKEDDHKSENALLYTLTFDVLYHSEDEISIAFDFLVWRDEEAGWERKEEIWEQDGMNYIFEYIGTEIFYFSVPTGSSFLYQDSMKESMEDNLDHEREVSSYEIKHCGKYIQNEDGEEVKWTYPQLIGEGRHLEKINADIEEDFKVLLEYSRGNHENKYEIARKTEMDYDITYHDKRVISILYKYVYYSKEEGEAYEDAHEDYKVSKSRFYSAIYDLDKGIRIQYDDLLDSSKIEEFTSLLHTIYSRKDEEMDRIFSVDNPVYYLRENEVSFLGSGECPEDYLEGNSMPAITIPYIIAQRAKTARPVWDWLLKTEKGEKQEKTVDLQKKGGESENK